MNYSKMNMQFICRMTMLLAFMFAACSENAGTSIDEACGGCTEETRGYALAGRVGDVYPKLLNYVDSAGADEDLAKIEGSLFASEGAIVTVYELDSSTLEKTGRSFTDTIDNDNGKFAFEELSLKSPYVLIEALDSCYEEDCSEHGEIFEKNGLFYEYSAAKKEFQQVLNAVVDLRKVNDVSVNSLTTAKVPLLRKNLEEGMAFVEASKMAEQTILGNLGIYEDLGGFEDAASGDSELPYVNELIRLSEGRMRISLNRADLSVFFASPKIFSARGALVEQAYLNSMKMIGYKIGYLAHQDGLGRCTESRENEMGVVKNFLGADVAVVCRSGRWMLGFKTVEHVKGVMTDNRDGKTYKTVTYNFGGLSQTWMAENLDFMGVDVLCFYYEDENEVCEDYGHAYRWNVAMGIDLANVKMRSVSAEGDTIEVSDHCMDLYVKDRVDGEYVWDSYEQEERENALDSCDAAFVYDGLTPEEVRHASWEGRIVREWAWNYADFVTPSNRDSYQGVCPDGWRIPNYDDWMTLLRNLSEQYGVADSNVVSVLYGDDATGFGLNIAPYFVVSQNLHISLSSIHLSLSSVDFENSFVMVDIPWYETRFFKIWKYGAGFAFDGRYTWHGIFDEPAYATPYDLYRKAFVRCIKQ